MKLLPNPPESMQSAELGWEAINYLLFHPPLCLPPPACLPQQTVLLAGLFAEEPVAVAATI